MKAFPHDFRINDGRKVSTGMDLRDYFAAKAMLGELSSQDMQIPTSVWSNLELLADKSYRIADAMMKARGE